MNKKTVFIALLGVVFTLAFGNSSAAADSYVLLFSKDQSLVSEAGYNVDHIGVVKHFVYDLAGVGTSYNVNRNGTQIPGSPYTVDENNSIYFETSDGGEFLISDVLPPEFSNINVNPSRLSAQPGYNVATITFTVNETLEANPSVKAGANDALFSGKTGYDYIYTYTTGESETEGAVNINISGTDLSDNSGSATCDGCLEFDFTAPATPGAPQPQ